MARSKESAAAAAKVKKPTTKEKGGRKTANTLSVMTIINAQQPSCVPSKKKRPSVLHRPTARANKDLDALLRSKPPRRASTARINSPFPVMRLPLELRRSVWDYTVVHRTFFIWPNTPTGAEQPDLAMVSRQVREEVLPIYYSKNIFAINLSPRKTGDSYFNNWLSDEANLLGVKRASDQLKKQRLDGLDAIEVWGSVLKKKDWFRYIRRWAFSYCPETADPAAQPNGGGDFLVFVNTWWKDEGNMWSGVVEVHCDALCLNSGPIKHQACRVQETPEWLNKALFRRLDEASRSGIGVETILEIASHVKSRGSQLGPVRCQKLLI